MPGITYRDHLVAEMMGKYFEVLLRDGERLADALSINDIGRREEIRQHVKIAHMIADEVIKERNANAWAT